MNKKFLALLLTGIFSVTTLTGCSSSEQSSSEQQKLVISTWGLNEDLLNETIFEPFEKEHNVDIILEIGNNSERLTKMVNNPNSNIDITYLAESFAQQGIEKGIFEKLDYSKIPNAVDLNEKAQTTVEAGYGPAYTLNSIGIVVNKDSNITIDSWDDLWSEELKGKIAIPDITTTFGPSMLEVASSKGGATLQDDNGESAFKELEALKPNVVKTYSKSSDLANMFSSGEIEVAVCADFAFSTIQNATPNVEFIIPESGTYLNFNTININKNSENKELAYEFINYVLSPEVQKNSALKLGDAPVNTKVALSEDEVGNMTYGKVIDNAKTLDFTFINQKMTEWIDSWNRIMNR